MQPLLPAQTDSSGPAAKAKRQWTIIPRPAPGRKPAGKKPIEHEEPEEEMRASKRERRQAHLSTLLKRIEDLESSERNLRQENERLRSELLCARRSLETRTEDVVPSLSKPSSIKLRPGRPNAPSQEAKQPIWAFHELKLDDKVAGPVCNGDPKTCAACADDPLGQAFCNALSKTVCSTAPCAGCPNRKRTLGIMLDEEVDMTEYTNDLCCGTPSLCGSKTCGEGSLSSSSDFASLRSVSSRAGSSAEMPANEAWRQLRAHPNIGFADLQMLADVVAQSSKCSGPRIPSPVPMPAMGLKRSALAASTELDRRPVSPRLTVDEEGVRAALALLSGRRESLKEVS
ncbi:uncharacterized protein L969DRAFT_84169 [Mixia osmundae IAM 14324]|uniref:BZIP domain-containing protein n=1 Tax=Mixia osmundae (strain CBS 9802 / IAM 14324 / JCM 22182 / KY 12970) TaxID=764103 RepID=G7EAG4_MIXOS|nr:uncharacterized protein L969DRAFT_84169 [Mixia osmundae IAM 14324]KEI42314.1 hypothetical protein L969DRAFT_84169 [Mixia osmundae IAM 14324]GAA99824.1 hypothetical protein E5Q_06527 [Mixia osmundae IAM 14324]